MAYKNPADKKAYEKAWHAKQRDEYYTVYYIPEKHYCGITNRPKRRVKEHGADNFKVLQICKTKQEARHYENLFHSWLCMRGMSTGH